MTVAGMSADALSELFDAHAVDVAPRLLGCRLTVSTPEEDVTVRLTEVEAYGGEGEDPGSHAYRGMTPRSASLFGPPRHVYVYRSYGIHFCMNLVSHAAGAGGVLLRAAEVLEGRGAAVSRRGGRDTGVKLLSGPGRLGQGLGADTTLDGAAVEIVQDPPQPRVGPQEGLRVVLAPPEQGHRPEPVSAGPRVGVSGEGGSEAYPWRFWLAERRSVSPYRASTRRRRAAP
ncbi:DNA-3-methyladenine glycosylase [Nesterenkonia sp. NBAIMH1]|uniref:DNA-3-methyladenine glycosylase n=1 Tax=Nesterenkonia sp. NBAIMH1 TaxID=2600320 RepID=UPI001FF051A1|nr:DNA-3-methyladenine glycosylase [Nesterenkonia sp. NBAIMH1]